RRDRGGVGGGSHGRVGGEELGLVGDILEGDRPPVGGVPHLFSLKDHEGRVAVQHLPGHLAEFFFQFGAGLFHRLARNVGGGRSIRAGVVGGHIGVCPKDGHFL